MTVSEIALKYIPPVQCIAHSKKICNKNAKHKSGMLKNINTKQTQEFYSMSILRRMRHSSVIGKSVKTGAFTLPAFTALQPVFCIFSG